MNKPKIIDLQVSPFVEEEKKDDSLLKDLQAQFENKKRKADRSTDVRKH